MDNLLQSKKLKIILLVIVLVLIVLLGIFAFKSGLSDEAGNEGKPAGVISNIEADHGIDLDEESLREDKGQQIVFMPKEDVYSFSMTEANGINLNFQRKNNEWIYKDNPDIDIDEERIDKVLNYLCDIRFVESFEADSKEDYGFVQGEKEYSISDSSGNEIIITMGEKKSNGEIYFALNYNFSTVYVNSGKISNVGDYAFQELMQL